MLTSPIFIQKLIIIKKTFNNHFRIILKEEVKYIKKEYIMLKGVLCHEY